MNIMKTNMLLLDNKIRKDDAENNTSTQAPVPSTVQPNAGMKALMFQGMQNLMANPMLAKEAGVMNDEPQADNKDSAKSFVAPYSSNIAFQGKFATAAKTAALAALLTLGAASCTKDRTEIIKDPVHVEQNVNVDVDLSPVTALLTSIQSTLLQMMIQQQDNGFLLQDQLNEVQALKAQLATDMKDVKAQMEAIKSVLKTIGNKVFEIDNHVVAGYNKNNAYHEAVIAYLSQFMTKDEAIFYFDKLYGQVSIGAISIDQAMNEIVNKWDETNSKIDDTNDKIDDIMLQLSKITDIIAKYDSDKTDLQNALDKLYNLVGNIYADGKNRTAIALDINRKLTALSSDVKQTKEVATQIRDNLKKGVSIDINQIKPLIKAMGISIEQAMAMDTAQLIEKMNEFIAGQDKIDKAIKKLDMNNDARTAYLANLIKNKTTDNADVIEAINNLALANEANIAAATENLAAKLDALIARADVSLGKLDGLARTGDKIYNKLDVDNKAILDQLKANGDKLRDANGKLDLNNLTLAELNAEAEKIKPELEKLNANAKDANNNLVKIDEDVLAIKQAIAELTAIAGDALTKDELEELWKAHDANAFAKAKAFLNSIHAEDIAKADEIIEYLKKGNKTAADTYQLLLDFANKANLSAEQLRDLLKAVYDYLPELKCQCNCSGDCGDNQHTHEGIIGVLN